MKYQIYEFVGITGNSSAVTVDNILLVEDMTADPPITMTEVAVAIDIAKTELEAYTDGAAADLQIQIEDLEDDLAALDLQVDHLATPTTTLIFSSSPNNTYNVTSLGTNGLSQNGRNVSLQTNGLGAPHTMIVDGFSGFSAGYIVHDIALSVTFTAGSGRTLVAPDGVVLTGRGSRAFIHSAGITDILRIYNIDTPQITLTWASAMTLDMALKPTRLLTLGGATTFNTPSNIAPGRGIELIISAGASDRALTFPAWKWMGTPPTTLLANKTMVLSLYSTTSALGGIIAGYNVES